MKKIITIVFLLCLSLAFVTPDVESAPKKSACKGLTKGQCTGKAVCVWVGSYKRKNGTKVKAHCRAKGKKGVFAKKKAKKTKLKKKRKVVKKKKAVSKKKKKLKKKTAK